MAIAIYRNWSDSADLMFGLALAAQLPNVGRTEARMDLVGNMMESKHTRVTADTNIFYYLASGALQKTDVIRGEELLYATPINLLEIVAGISFTEWTARRDAAKAIVNFADGMSADPEEHLAALIERREPVVDEMWIEGAKALSQATNEGELQSGVVDVVERVTRSVRPAIAAAAKAQHYEGFKDDILKVCEDMLPGYRSAVEAGTQAPVVGKQVRGRLRAYLSSPEFVGMVFFAGLNERYKTFGTKTVDLQSNDTFDALRDLAPYCAIYGAYLQELLTARRKPDSNDWGDLELFMYLQPSNFVATTEKKWWTFATLVGLGSRVRQLKPKDVILDV